MATKDEVMQAIAQEKEEVLAHVQATEQKIQELKDQLENGGTITAADLDDIKTAVHNIHIPLAE